MTNDSNSDQPETAADQSRSANSGGMTASDWDSLATNPDNKGDLGYHLLEWERFETPDSTDQLIFLPNDDTAVADAAFVVADEDSVIDLNMRR